MSVEDLLALTPVPAHERIPYGDDPNQFCDVYRPHGDASVPVVVLLHGGCWQARFDLSHLSPLAAALAAAGYGVLSVEYRRLGHDDGGWPGTFSDVLRASAALTEHAGRLAFDLERLAVVGHSAGGHLALWLGGMLGRRAHPALPVPAPLTPRAVVALAGIPDLPLAAAQAVCGTAAADLLRGAPVDAVSPRQMLPLGVPQILLQGDADAIVPTSYVTAYADSARAAGDPVVLRELKSAGHFELVTPQSVAWPALQEALSEATGA